MKLIHTRNRVLFGTLALGVVMGAAVEDCHRSDGEPGNYQEVVSPPQVSTDGGEIRFASDSPQLLQIATDTVREGLVQIDLSAPVHCIVSVARSEFGTNNLYLFENQDLTQLYADFLKSASAVSRSLKNVERLRDLLSHKAAAEKEVVDAQTEFAQSQAEMAEKESRMRAAGIDPKGLERAEAGTVVAIADVPERQSADIRMSTTAEVLCGAFPGEPFSGKVVSIGDVIDPNTRTVKVRITLSNPHNRLRAGMFGTAHLAGSRERTLTIPRSCVVNIQGKAFVFRQNEAGDYRRKEVLLGAETPGLYVVKAGVQ